MGVPEALKAPQEDQRNPAGTPCTGRPLASSGPWCFPLPKWLRASVKSAHRTSAPFAQVGSQFPPLGPRLSHIAPQLPAHFTPTSLPAPEDVPTQSQAPGSPRLAHRCEGTHRYCPPPITQPEPQSRPPCRNPTHGGTVPAPSPASLQSSCWN